MRFDVSGRAGRRLPNGGGEEPASSFRPVSSGRLARLAGSAAIPADLVSSTIADAIAPAAEAGAETPARTEVSPADLRGALSDFRGRLPIVDRFPIDRFPIDIPELIPIPISKTATQLAEFAIAQLDGATPAIVREALQTVANKNVRPSGLLDYLERKVRVGEVLNQMAHTWSEQTKADFADRNAFQMDVAKTDVMDAIVSIAILNDDDLENEVRAENLTEATPEELLDNRVVRWQWPAGGTVMSPPYLILVAVEYRAITQAEDEVRKIIGQLVEFDGARLPRTTVQKLGG
jgi:hypothetical protein